jgi:hypothetical protein
MALMPNHTQLVQKDALWNLQLVAFLHFSVRGFFGRKMPVQTFLTMVTSTQSLKQTQAVVQEDHLSSIVSNTTRITGWPVIQCIPSSNVFHNAHQGYFAITTQLLHSHHPPCCTPNFLSPLIHKKLPLVHIFHPCSLPHHFSSQSSPPPQPFTRFSHD